MLSKEDELDLLSEEEGENDTIAPSLKTVPIKEFLQTSTEHSILIPDGVPKMSVT
jgi:hypothetical protein